METKRERKFAKPVKCLFNLIILKGDSSDLEEIESLKVFEWTKGIQIVSYEVKQLVEHAFERWTEAVTIQCPVQT